MATTFIIISHACSVFFFRFSSCSMERGIFIVLEGTDRIGKSTQAKMLESALTRLYGTETLSVRFPDRNTPLGQSLNTYLNGKLELNHHAVHLLFTANRWERAAEINQALEAGRCVVADRYSYSGIVYTAAKEPNPPSWEWCKRTEECLPQPDLIICLLPATLADLTKRGGFGDERFENAEFQSRVMQNYRRLAEDINAEALRAPEAERKPKWEWVIASDMTPQQVHDVICEVLKTKLTHCPQLCQHPPTQ
ncbi:unnamed protein product [Schistocephalus solidus]|uniref:dTMP kinase n=1 Tax=Schistocephalus solidus TaxID=70667 RepID=A0A183SWK8_SCHSO|nr:unnamed protein product [Schistocephalus solidus]